MTSLVKLERGVAVTTTLAIADGTKNGHDGVIKLVRKYEDDLLEFGLVGFEIRAREAGKHGGGDVEYAVLNEQQATLLLTYMRNSQIVRVFKKNLVKDFWAMAEKLRSLSVQRQDAYWQQKRLEGKTQRLALASVIQDFVSYAKQQGSQNAEKYYMSITKMEYAALELVKLASDKSFRDTLDAVQHSQLTVVEMACQESLRQGMDEGLPYKDCYQMAKAACLDLAASLRKHLPRRASPMMLAPQKRNARTAGTVQARIR